MVVVLLLFTIGQISFSYALTNANRIKLENKAVELSALATGLRNYYTESVVSRIIENDGKAAPSSVYRELHGGIPIPATFSIELGQLFKASGGKNQRIKYEFLSDYPFRNRKNRMLSEYDTESLELFRSDPFKTENIKYSGNFFQENAIQLSSPVVMKASCVACHNSHPDSPRTNWKVGDIRGIQKVTVRSSAPFVTQFVEYGPLSIFSIIAISIVLLVFRAANNRFIREKDKRRLLQHQVESLSKSSDVYLRKFEESKILIESLENSIVGFTICDMNRRDCPAIYVNKAFSQITGYSKEFALGKNCRYLQGPLTEKEELTKIRLCIQSGMTYTGVITNYRSDGTIFRNRLTLIPIINHNATKPAYYIANQVIEEANP